MFRPRAEVRPRRRVRHHGRQIGHADPAMYRGENLLLTDLQTEVRQDQTSRPGNPSIPAAPLDFKDFIPAAENPLSKASDGKAVGLEAGGMK